MHRLPRGYVLTALTAVTALALAGCAGSSDGDESSAGGGLTVLTTFYPLQFVAEHVGGDLVEVSNLTPAGAEPHDLELSPVDVLTLEDADVVVYLSGFQPAIDDALTGTSGPLILDTADAADLVIHGGAESEGAAGDEHDEAEDGHTEDDGHDHGLEGEDPHFWLDPTRVAAVAEVVADTFSEADPDNADTYTANAQALTAELTGLDEEYTAALGTCERDVIVVSHAAFGYLTDRYGLTQVGISGLDPESEPAPARLTEIGHIVEESGVTTIFTETLISPKVAEVLAEDLGIDVGVLDPIEGLTDAEQDYLSVMRTNLDELTGALGCA
ncbi:metal ABC transporter substrate-binding protein [Occultella aeris]|uniref:High-affinity zinc uptake system binding-protein ZnuA n=1 Tax=Occultella aeris TaxID=2761496 RepID=A0A7M4DQP5_9MICO|nr:metal ABC transporter substrate-binding protein [Occultella aeris]VZO39789.1 High-affinity zinc uptake system binding-protein ZnuA precursor [Occultella aeris]